MNMDFLKKYDDVIIKKEPDCKIEIFTNLTDWFAINNWDEFNSDVFFAAETKKINKDIRNNNQLKNQLDLFKNI